MLGQHGDMVHDGMGGHAAMDHMGHMEPDDDVDGSYDDSGTWGVHGNHEAVAMDMAMLGFVKCAARSTPSALGCGVL